MARRLTHFNAKGDAVMVDVTDKGVTERIAIASGAIIMQPATLKTIVSKKIAKGDVLTVAQLAGIMAAKRTHELIPLCHPLALSAVTVELKPNARRHAVEITATVKISGKTGVEMEALTAVSVAALTVYDMCKAIDRGMTISDVKLMHKSGGKSGTFQR